MKLRYLRAIDYPTYRLNDRPYRYDDSLSHY